MPSKLLKEPPAFTLLEILIVFSLIILLAIAAFIILNPKKQLEKTYDGKRKQELTTIKKVLEDWYNDKNCYPKPSEICYDSPDSNNTCHICGTKSSRNLSPYLSSLPCDPQSPKKNYLYQVDNITCPKWYRIYADLSFSDYTNNDPATELVGCFSQSCGPAPDYGYDYGASSPNIDLERKENFVYCALTGCNFCGAYQNCLKINIQYFCDKIKRIYPDIGVCNEDCPCHSKSHESHKKIH